MKFTKMHGLGNDYVYVNGFREKVEDPETLARFVSDRHFGIGSDGLVLILPSDTCDFRMRMFNNDGSEAEMCGNASRCVAKYVYDNGLTVKDEITLETLAGVKILKMEILEGKVRRVTVNMGAPILEPEEIPVDMEGASVISREIQVAGEAIPVTCVSMGNPHAIVFVEDAAHYPVEVKGPLLENHPLFPRRINAEFAEILSRDRIRMRVWERGSGETLACGTGACATLVAAALNGLTERQATLELLGGELEIRWSPEDNNVYMTGLATTVFNGEIDLAEAGMKG